MKLLQKRHSESRPNPGRDDIIIISPLPGFWYVFFNNDNAIIISPLPGLKKSRNGWNYYSDEIVTENGIPNPGRDDIIIEKRHSKGITNPGRDDIIIAMKLLQKNGIQKADRIP